MSKAVETETVCPECMARFVFVGRTTVAYKAALEKSGWHWEPYPDDWHRPGTYLRKPVCPSCPPNPAGRKGKP